MGKELFMGINILNTMNPTLTLLDSDKGDIGNRTACAADLAGNGAKALVKDTFVLGGAAGAGYAVVKKSNVIKDVINTVVDGLKKHIPDETLKSITTGFDDLIKNNSIAESVVKFVKSNKKVSALIAIGAAAAGALSFITANHLHKGGAIQQKYEDKAKLKEFRGAQD